MVSSSSCRYDGAGVKTIRQSSNSSRVRNPAPLGCVTCFFFLIIFIYIFLNGSWCPLFFFSNWELVPFIFCHFSVFLFVFNYTPIEVVPPVGMLVCTAAYTLAADGAVLNTPKKN